jgi:mannose-1-phosphate guanylyltransferase/mannose-6-phosphate isomerase
MQLVIMAGGSGSRLWPVSRSNFPKQFINLMTSNSMLQDTLMRAPSETKTSPYVICNESTRFLVAEELQKINVQNPNIILEPEGRNTAPAIALAAFDALKKRHDPVLVVLASDHVIKDEKAFHEALNSAEHAALNDKLVTFGIVPTHPETGYGYIKKGQQSSEGFEVTEFVEKPNLETAEVYFASSDYLWNSGMFAFKASVYLAELKKFNHDIYKICEEAINNKTEDLDFIRISKDIFKNCPDDSIDYAVMEKTSDSVVIPLDAGWSDVGSWSSLYEISEKDDSNNVAFGDVISRETVNCYIRGGERLVATLGVKDLVIVDTKDALLVAHKDSTQDVKKIVNQLKEQQRSEYAFHREVYRPWGKYDSIDNGERYQVKRITVKPGAKLSLQMHHHRAEHWIVVSGTAKVTIGDKDIMLSENQSTYIPIGEIHALENPGKITLELIEVQSGSYLGEDDIVRFEDRYGRA